MNWNWVFRAILIGPLVRLFFPLRITGLEKLPTDRPFILAIGPHSTEMESVIIASHLWRFDTRFFIKASYLELGGNWKSRIRAWFFRATDQIPVDRLSVRGAITAMKRAVNTLSRGISAIVYPEATRYYDGMLHPAGSTLVPSTAWEATRDRRARGLPAVDVYPVGTKNFLAVQPESAKRPRPFVRAELHIGAPLRVDDFMPPEALRMIMSDGMVKTRVVKYMNEAMQVAIAELADTRRSPIRATIAES